MPLLWRVLVTSSTKWLIRWMSCFCSCYPWQWCDCWCNSNNNSNNNNNRNINNRQKLANADQPDPSLFQKIRIPKLFLNPSKPFFYRSQKIWSRKKSFLLDHHRVRWNLIWTDLKQLLGGVRRNWIPAKNATLLALRGPQWFDQLFPTGCAGFVSRRCQSSFFVITCVGDALPEAIKPPVRGFLIGQCPLVSNKYQNPKPCQQQHQDSMLPNSRIWLETVDSHTVVQQVLTELLLIVWYRLYK